MSLMISVSGIRGIVGKELTPDLILNFSSAFGTYIGGGKVIVGRDPRKSGEMLKNSVFAGLLATGCQIIDIGISPTPTIEIAVKEYGADGGIAITASHNPAEWNAVKFINSKGLFLDDDEGDRVLEIFKNRKFEYVNTKSLKNVKVINNAVDKHIEKILNLTYIDKELIKNRKFSAAIDCVNGTGGVLFPKLLEKLNCRIDGINIEPDGDFKRNPEPTKNNLDVFSGFIKNKNFDIGFACDPDADRLSVVDENGTALGEEFTLIAAVDYLLSKKKGTVVINESTSMGVEYVASKYGCNVIRTKVGEINVSKKMIELESPIGGEGNGGVILPDVHVGRDSFTGAVLMLQLLAEKNITLSEYFKTLPEYFMIKEKLNVKIDSYEVLSSILKKNDNMKEYSFTDGIRIKDEDWWVHIRRSNTEPIVRIIAESESEEKTKQVVDKYKSIIMENFSNV